MKHNYSTITLAIPYSLVFLRLFLAPVILLLLLLQVSDIWFVVCLIIGLGSDIFDGIIARRLGVASTNLRRWDTVVDSILFAVIIMAAWVTNPVIFAQYLIGILVIITIKLVRILYDYWKYKKEAAYHMWSTKFWGITLLVTLVVLWLDGNVDLLFQMSIIVGLVTNLEGLLASLILPEWQHDIPSLWHAIQLRKMDFDG